MLKIILKCLLLLVLVEGIYRLGLGADYSWYNCLDDMEQVTGVDIRYIFIGSSRVKASIIPPAFHADNVDAPEREVANMGMGNTTLAAHYFGLKKLIDVLPNQLNNTVVFLESTHDFPEMSRWDGPWVENNRTDLLGRVLDYDDLYQFVLQSGDDTEAKVAVVFDKLFYFYRAKGSGMKWLQRYENVLRADGILPKVNMGDLIQGGGIKATAEDIKKAHDFAIAQADKDSAAQKLAKHYPKESYVLYSLNKLIQDNRGRLIVFDVPMSDVQKRAFAGLVFRQNKEYVDGRLQEWGISQISPQMRTSDDDFPDLWHLSASRAPEFTTTVSKSYHSLLQEEKAKGSSKKGG